MAIENRCYPSDETTHKHQRSEIISASGHVLQEYVATSLTPASTFVKPDR